MYTFVMCMVTIPLACYIIRFWGTALRALIKGKNQIGKKISRIHAATTAALREDT